jgi:hypothetical protein
MATAQAFGMIYQKQPNKKFGRTVLLPSFGHKAESLVQDIRLLLAFK